MSLFSFGVCSASLGAALGERCMFYAESFTWAVPCSTARTAGNRLLLLATTLLLNLKWTHSA
jgi:hypothetical protein